MEQSHICSCVRHVNGVPFKRWSSGLLHWISPLGTLTLVRRQMSLIASSKYSMGICLHPQKPSCNLAGAAVCAHETSRGAQGIGSPVGGSIWLCCAWSYPALSHSHFPKHQQHSSSQNHCKENIKLKLKEGGKDIYLGSWSEQTLERWAELHTVSALMHY